MRVIKMIPPIFALFLLGFGCTKLSTLTSVSTDSPLASSIDTSNWKTYTNCGVSFKYPNDWTGDTFLMSPSSLQKASEYLKNHPELLVPGEGGLPSAQDLPQFADFSINCVQSLPTYINNFAGSEYYSIVASKGSFYDLAVGQQVKTGNKYQDFTVIEKMKVGDRFAFEVKTLSTNADGEEVPYYEIRIYQDHVNYNVNDNIDRSQVYFIPLKDTEYENQSPTVKSIIASITFTK